MIFVADSGLDAVANAQLATWQAEINALPDYPSQVAGADNAFKSRNKKGNLTFDAVKTSLTVMCCGARRCHYCEDSQGTQVEHIWPKSWYPSQCFVWENYLYACSGCNGPKNNQFAVFKTVDGLKAEFAKRKKGEPVVPPLPGTMVLLNPRIDNALEYLILDIQNGTFHFAELEEDISATANQRAEYTKRVLGLNKNLLPDARRSAYGHYRRRLAEYIAHKAKGVPQTQLDEMIAELKTDHHQTVWQEMKRQQQQIPELQNLFDQAKEALTW